MSAKIISLVGEKLLHGGVAVETATVLKDKLVALYFSAHWCPPCRQFTPEFGRIYNALQSSNKPLAVVFVSADQDLPAFKEYFSEQPWYAIPYEATEVRDHLNDTFNIKGIPALLVLNSEGELLSKEGRLEVMKNKERAFDLWEQKALKVQKANNADRVDAQRSDNAGQVEKAAETAA